MKHYIKLGNPMHAQFDALAHHQAEHFAYSFDEGVATLTLNRPERKNPLTFDSYAELRDLFRMLNSA
ncbi:MAG: enoyl-CoA hydratase, partial [Polaromonas sp.]|nr:enoyl-CoA hydratase [Polaromonas sp.]